MPDPAPSPYPTPDEVQRQNEAAQAASAAQELASSGLSAAQQAAVRSGAVTIETAPALNMSPPLDISGMSAVQAAQLAAAYQNRFMQSDADKGAGKGFTDGFVSGGGSGGSGSWNNPSYGGGTGGTGGTGGNPTPAPSPPAPAGGSGNPSLDSIVPGASGLANINGIVPPPEGFTWGIDPITGKMELVDLTPLDPTKPAAGWRWIPDDPKNPTGKGHWTFMPSPDVLDKPFEGIPPSVIPWLKIALDQGIGAVPEGPARSWVEYIINQSERKQRAPGEIPFGMGLPNENQPQPNIPTAPGAVPPADSAPPPSTQKDLSNAIIDYPFPNPSVTGDKPPVITEQGDGWWSTDSSWADMMPTYEQTIGPARDLPPEIKDGDPMMNDMLVMEDVLRRWKNLSPRMWERVKRLNPEVFQQMITRI